MKRTLVSASIILGLISSLWIGFSCGVYYHARLADAFTANQVLLVRQMSVQHADPMVGAKYADAMATRWETRAENTSFMEALDPHNVPNLLSLSGEKILLQRNHESREQFLAVINHH